MISTFCFFFHAISMGSGGLNSVGVVLSGRLLSAFLTPCDMQLDLTYILLIFLSKHDLPKPRPIQNTRYATAILLFENSMMPLYDIRRSSPCYTNAKSFWLFRPWLSSVVTKDSHHIVQARNHRK